MLTDENLSWKHHILNIASKISTSIGIIARLRHFVPLNTLQYIYRSLIQPYLLYGITAWGRAGKTHRNIIPRLQKRALRLMFFCDYKTHAIPLFICSSLLPLDLLYFKSVAILMHDVSNNISPPQISNLFHYQHNIHSYITRSSTRGNFFLKYSRINKQNMTFQGMVLESGIAYLVNFIKCLKRNLNATFTICSFRNSRRQMNILIYRI